MPVADTPTTGSRPASWTKVAVAIAWSITLFGLMLRPLVSPRHDTVLSTYVLGGSHWIHGEAIYQAYMGFVYSPLAAACFAPFTGLPFALGWVVFLAVNAGVFLLGVRAMLRSGIYPNLRREFHWAAYVLVIPLVLPSLDIAQANPLSIGLLMLAVAAAARAGWSMAAICVALAAYLKIYPLVVGLLFVVIAPAKFGWRLLLALLALGLAPFLLQHWDYVLAQYHSWAATRLADNRLVYSQIEAPLDLWLLLVRIGGLGISPLAYKCFQIVSGGSIALLCFIGTRRRWPRERVLTALFSLASIWMTLCGPATERYTYAILAPAVVFALVQAYVQPRPAWHRALVSTSFALLFLAIIKNSVVPGGNHIFWTGAMQPLGALFFLAYCLPWLLDSAYWRDAKGEAQPKTRFC